MEETAKLELVSAEDVLGASDLERARELAAEFPAVSKAIEELKASYQDAAEKYFTLCRALRASKLNGRESTLILRAHGLPKSRISEIRRVYEVDDVTWAAYEQRAISFKGALAAARTGEIASPGCRPAIVSLPEILAKPIEAVIAEKYCKLPTGKYRFELDLTPDAKRPTGHVKVTISVRIHNELAAKQTKTKKAKPAKTGK